MGLFSFIFGSFLLVQALFPSATASGLNCWTCKDASSNEDCIAQRATTKCDASFTACVKWGFSLLNTTTGKTGIKITQECGHAAYCANEKLVCDSQNSSTKAPMKMLVCNLTCCTSGPDCVNVTGETTPIAPTVVQSTSAPTPTVVQSTSAPTTKLPAAYTASLWATDMSMCKQKCCGGTPAQIWQNRSCCPVRAGGCLSVPLAKEVKCEDTYCNEQHCGACQIGQKPLMIMIAVIVSVLYEFLL